MNNENSTTDSTTDLGFAPSLLDFHISKPHSDELGAGANADLRADIKFGASDQLNELVWSPRTGVGLRSANHSANCPKKSLVWGAGRSTIASSPVPLSTSTSASCAAKADIKSFVGLESRSTGAERHEGLHDKSAQRAVEYDGGYMKRIVTAPPQRIDVKDPLVDPENEFFNYSTHLQSEERVNDKFESFPDTIGGPPLQKMDDDDNLVSSERESFCGPNLQSEEIPQRITKDFQSLPESTKAAEKRPSGIPREVACVDQSPRLDSASAPCMENTLENKMNGADIIPNPPLDRLESMAENELPAPAEGIGHGLSRAPYCMVKCYKLDGKQVGKTDSSSQSQRSNMAQNHGQKAQERALSDGEVRNSKTKDEEDSHESVESCNSASLSRNKKRSDYGKELVLRNKRVRRHEEECSGSGLKAKPGGSFINWISNMVKNAWKMEEDDPRSMGRALAVDNHEIKNANQDLVIHTRNQGIKNENTGFRSLFRSVRCLQTKRQEEPSPCDQDQTEFELPGKMLGLKAAPISCYGQGIGLHGDEISSKVKTASSTEMETKPNGENMTDSPENKRSDTVVNCKELYNTNPKTCPLDPKAPLKMKVAEDLSKGDEKLGSLWIDRFVSKGSGFPNKPKDLPSCRLIDTATSVVIPLAGDAKENDAEIDASVDVSAMNWQEEKNLIHNLGPILPSEAMASVFARRLIAIKQFMPVMDIPIGSSATTCFFCGKMGHSLHDCSEIAYDELRDLLSNLNADGAYAKVGSSQCFKCSQPGHWPVNCPTTSLKRQHDGKAKTNPCLPCVDQAKSEEKATTRVAASTSKLKEVVSSSDHSDARILDVSKAIFDAVQMLRLSRTDILNWENSTMPRSHLEGFFLRLRLRKWGGSLGRTGYYVACITDASAEESAGNSRRSIYVKVGELNCAVEPQYISNHGFHEEELRAWWRATAKHGQQIPSEEDLRRKLDRRRVLGL